MGGRNHFRQPPPRVGTVRILSAEAARRDQQLAGAVHTRTGNLLQPLIGVGVQAQAEQIDPEADEAAWQTLRRALDESRREVGARPLFADILPESLR